jgi:hypothetical protein
MNTEYQLILYGKPVEVKNLKEAEDRLKRSEYSDFSLSYIVRRVYNKKGELVEEVMVG